MQLDLPTTMTPVLFLAGYLVAGGISTALAAYVVRCRWKQPAARAFGVVSIALGVWAFAYVGRMLSPSLPTKLLWTQLAWIGIAVTPVAVFAFVLLFTGRSHLISRRVIGSLLVIPFVTQAMLLTNEHHSLFYREVWLYTGDTIPFIASRGGLWFYGVHIPYSWGLYFVATVLLVQFAFSARSVYRSQTLALSFGAIFPWIVNGTFLAGIRVHPELDPTPIGIAVGMGAIGIAVFRVELLGILPVARERVLDEVAECIFVLDDEHRIIDVNEAGHSFLLSCNETPWTVGDPASEVFPSELATYGFPEDESKTENEVRLSVDGRDGWYIHRRYRLGQTIYSGQIVTLTDISPQKRHQMQLERKNDQLEQVAGIMSHDLRNPLSVAVGFLQIVAGELEDIHMSEGDRIELGSAIERIEDAHGRMDDLINDVLVLARSGHLLTNTKPIELNSVARSAWEHVTTDGIRLEVAGSTTVVGDEGRLLRVFENLFRNTVSHGGGATTIRIGVLDDGFFVEDDGIGIPVEKHRAIFDRGVTGDTDGTGLGLSIVRNVVEAHGWRVNVMQGADGGARFEITGVKIAEP